MVSSQKPKAAATERGKLFQRADYFSGQLGQHSRDEPSFVCLGHHLEDEIRTICDRLRRQER
jgi:hypothetical protein